MLSIASGASSILSYSTVTFNSEAGFAISSAMPFVTEHEELAFNIRIRGFIISFIY